MISRYPLFTVYFSAYLQCGVRVQVNMRISSTFSNKLSAVNVVVLIPVPEHTSSADIQVQPRRPLARPRVIPTIRRVEKLQFWCIQVDYRVRHVHV